MFRSFSDDGINWNPANSGLPATAKINSFTFVDTILFAATNYGVYSSADSGSSWKIDTTGLTLNQICPGREKGFNKGITASNYRIQLSGKEEEQYFQLILI